MFIKKASKILTPLMLIAIGFYAVDILAEQTIGGIADKAAGNLASILKLVTGASYLAGFGLTIGALFKFKKHKENPQQTELSACIVMLLIGIALIFLPSIIGTGGATLGITSGAGSIGGVSSF